MKDKILELVKKHPGIRPKELHKLLGIKHSSHLRNSLIKAELVKKVRKGNAVYYYPL